MDTVVPEEIGVSSERLERLSKLMRRYVDSGHLAGIVTMLARGGEVFHAEAFGMMDKEAQKPMDVDSLFRIYSMTKPITSAAAMMLYEEGHFQLDDPVSNFLPEFKDTKVYAGMGEGGMILEEQKRPMTVRNLLTHTAGLSYGSFQDSPIEEMYRNSEFRQRDKPLAECAKELAQLPLLYQPGTKWRYSVATDVLGYLVEVISGQPFDEYLRDNIFKPLGMDDTSFYVPEEKLDRLAKVYGPNGNGGIKELTSPQVNKFKSPVAFISGGGGLVSTAADYMKFCQMMLNNGELDGTRLLGRKTVEMITMNHLSDALMPFAVREGMANNYGGCGFGLGYSVVLDVAEYGVLASEGEYSWGGAASTAFWIDPEEEMIVIFMTQFMPSGTHPIRKELHVMVNQAIVD